MMEVVQVRMPKAVIAKIDSMVEKGYYSSSSDLVRDAVRRLVLEKHIGSISNTGDSVEEVREIRKKLSKEKFDLEEINRLGR